MKSEWLVRGRGFIGSNLIDKVGADYLPREWTDIPNAKHIVNVSAYGNQYEQTEKFLIYKVNLMDSLRLLEDAEGYDSLVLVSTSSVLIPHQTAYSTSKKACEDLVSIYGGPVVAVRPSTVTGIGEQQGRLIPKLIRSCLYGERMPFVPDATHDFIDVDDFTDGIIYVSNNIKDYQGKVINISSGVSRSNQEVKDIIEEVTGRKANVDIIESMRNYDTTEWFVEDHLPELPKKPLEQIISKMVEHERQNT